MDRPSCRAAWALVLVTFAGLPALAGSAPGSPRPTPPVRPSATPSRPPNPRARAIVAVPTQSVAGSYLYARRTRRLVQSYLRLKLLELREADLERARAVIERRLGPDALLVPPPPLLPGARPGPSPGGPGSPL